MASNHRRQFSLRFLLVLTSVCGLSFGLLVPPLFDAWNRVGFFALPVYLFGLETGGMMTVVLFWGSLVLTIIFIFPSIRSNCRWATRTHLTCLFACYWLFFTFRDPNVASWLIVILLVSVIVSAAFTDMQGADKKLVCAGFLWNWLAFWFVSSGLLLTM